MTILMQSSFIPLYGPLPAHYALYTKTGQHNRIMPTITCLVCKRPFRAPQYFTQHLNYKKNAKCKAKFCKQLQGLSPNSSPFLLSPTAKDVYTPCSKKQKMAGHACDTHKPVRRTLNMDPLQPEQDPQQQEHVVLLEEEVVVMDEQDQVMDDADFPHNDDDNPLHVQPIHPPVAPEMEGVHPDFANIAADHADKSKIMDDFEQYVQAS